MEKKNIDDGSYASLLLTGDLRGLRYLKERVTRGIPKDMFRFCCTVEGCTKYETDIMAQTDAMAVRP